MIDLHCHLLAGVDDGSRSVQQSRDVLSRFVEQGITGVVLTPHIQASALRADPDGAVAWRDAALAELEAVAPDGIRLHPGFEIMMDEPLAAGTLADRRFALARSRYYLVEFPVAVAGDPAGGILERMTESGIVPMVAHPERYGHCSLSTIRRWREAGARIQVDATTLTRPTLRGERARALLNAGLVDVLAADNHGDDRMLGTAVTYLAARHGGAAAVMLTELNPAAVLRDEPLEPVPAVKLREGIAARIRRWLAP